MNTYRIETFKPISGEHNVLQVGDCFQWNGGDVTAMLIRRVDGEAQAVLLTKTTVESWSGEYKQGDEQVSVALTFNGNDGVASRTHALPDEDTGSFTAAQQF